MGFFFVCLFFSPFGSPLIHNYLWIFKFCSRLMEHCCAGVGPPGILCLGSSFSPLFFFGGGVALLGSQRGGIPPTSGICSFIFFSTATLRVRSLLLLGGGRGRPGVPPLLCHPHGCSGAGGVQCQVQGAASVGQWGGGGIFYFFFFSLFFSPGGVRAGAGPGLRAASRGRYRAPGEGAMAPR